MIDKKTCLTCGIEKNIYLFSSDKSKSDGKQSVCKSCRKNFYHKNKTAINEKRKDYRDTNKEKVLEQKRITLRNLYARSKGYIDHDDFIRHTFKLKNIFNYGPEFLKAYRDYHRGQKRISDNEKIKIKRRTDLQFRLIDNLRARTRKVLKIQSANKHTGMAKLIGCSGKELADRFIQMGYNPEADNIDHIIPMSKFNLSVPEHQLISCHYLNLRPLNALDNMSKSDSLPADWSDKIIQICEERGIKSIPVIKYFIKGIACQSLV
jgi:Fe-S cluster biosynthesis and repair protein YggX